MKHRCDIYWKYSNVHLCFPGLILSFSPSAFSQQHTLPHSRKLPAVTHIFFFQNDFMLVHRCRTSFHKKSNCTLLKLLLDQPCYTVFCSSTQLAEKEYNLCFTMHRKLGLYVLAESRSPKK